MYITNRERSIIKLLLKSQHLFVSMGAMRKELDVSKRTVQRDVKQLENTLQAFHLKLEKQPGEGIRIQGSRSDFEALRSALKHTQETEMHREERMLIILHELIQADAPIKATRLSVELGVSNTTLLQDIEQLEKMIRGTRLQLLRKRGYGVELLGSEKERRMFFISQFLRRLDKSIIFSVKEGEFLSFGTRDRIYRLIEPRTFIMLEKLMLEHLKELPYQLTDLSLLEVLLHVYLTLKRIQMGRIVESDANGGEDAVEDILARSIFRELSEILSVSVPVAEERFLSTILRSTKRIRDDDHESDTRLFALAGQLIEEVSRATGYYFNKDKRFVGALVSHLEPLFNRIHQGVTVANPIKREIQEDYSMLYNALDFILQKLFPEMKFNEDEVGFLTLHFASVIHEFKEVPKVSTLVVCTSGIATSRMLTKRLLDKFPQLTIIEQGSVRQLKKLDLQEFDLIISTVGIHGAQFDYIQVSPMLIKEDEDVLEPVINGILMGASRNRCAQEDGIKADVHMAALLSDLEVLEEAGNVIRQVLEGFAVHAVEARNIAGLLAIIQEHLRREGEEELEDAVFQALLEKEQCAGSGIPDSSITFLHGRADGATQIHYRLYKFNEPIVVKGMDGQKMSSDTVIFLLTPEKLSEVTLEMVSTMSVVLLEDKVRALYVHGAHSAIYRLLEMKFKAAYFEIIQRLWKKR